MSHLCYPSFPVCLCGIAGAIVEVEPDECERDTSCLDGCGFVSEPDDGEDDDEDALDERGDRVCDG